MYGLVVKRATFFATGGLMREGEIESREEKKGASSYTFETATPRKTQRRKTRDENGGREPETRTRVLYVQEQHSKVSGRKDKARGKLRVTKT